MVNTNALKARMILEGVTAEDMTQAQGWKCVATAYRKINGQSAFTVYEAWVCKKLLRLSDADVLAIFFAQDLS